MSSETLHFKVGLGGTYWNKVPAYSIMLNDTEIMKGQITAPSGECEYIEFDAELPEGTNALKIRLENKDNSDVVKDDSNKDDFVIVKDMLLDIHSILIDELDLGTLTRSCSSFTGDDITRPVLTNCVNLGWNGTWTLTFDSPFYMWLLENL